MRGSEPEAGVRPLTTLMRYLLYAASVLVFLAGFQLTVFTAQTGAYFAWTILSPITAAFLGAAYWAAVPTDYVHRVGRTARMEAAGEAITFVTPDDEGDFRGIERALGKSIPRVTLPDFDYRAPPPPKVRGHEGTRRERETRSGGGPSRWRPRPGRR